MNKTFYRFDKTKVKCANQFGARSGRLHFTLLQNYCFINVHKNLCLSSNIDDDLLSSVVMVRAFVFKKCSPNYFLLQHCAFLPLPFADLWFQKEYKEKYNLQQINWNVYSKHGIPLASAYVELQSFGVHAICEIGPDDCICLDSIKTRCVSVFCLQLSLPLTKPAANPRLPFT